MSSYLNLEKPQENDLNWGNKLNSNFDKIDAEASRANTELGKKADINHTHNFNNVFAPLVHRHDDLYPPIGHNHNNLYPPINHNHNELYPLKNHNHNDLYALLQHTHSGFANTVHSHAEITALQNRMSLAESRINTLFNDKADKTYVVNLLKNFDHSVAGITPVININGKGSGSQNVRVNAWINSPAFLLEWHLSFQWSGQSHWTHRVGQNSSEFLIPKPSTNSPLWNGKTMIGITIKIKCKNPFLQNDWSNEATITDSEIMIFNFIDADHIIAALAMNTNFQTTMASAIVSNPNLAERIIHSVNQHQTPK